MSELEISLGFPVDADGFLRCACPGCELEFKRRPSEGGDASTGLAGDYHCPYCGERAAADRWFTIQQSEYISHEVMAQALGPALEELDSTLRGLSRATGGLISGHLELPERHQAPPIFEPNDMKRVEFACHSDGPLKVLDSWAGKVHCLICGSQESS